MFCQPRSTDRWFSVLYSQIMKTLKHIFSNTMTFFVFFLMPFTFCSTASDAQAIFDYMSDWSCQWWATWDRGLMVKNVPSPHWQTVIYDTVMYLFSVSPNVCLSSFELFELLRDWYIFFYDDAFFFHWNIVLSTSMKMLLVQIFFHFITHFMKIAQTRNASL